ncbi:MAG: thrombospondin type 3 repeat-containing protein [Polyangiales bacterium]
MRQVLIAILLAACGGPQSQGLQGSQKDTDGDGVRDIDDKCAYDPGPSTPNGCPEKQSEIKVLEGDHAPLQQTAADRDGDGTVDNLDKCPDEPEDKDGFQDDDGCPDPDNDQDGIRDVDDLCPNDAEDKDGVKDEDGCPER